jgi:lipid A 4'-phosphatase
MNTIPDPNTHDSAISTPHTVGFIPARKGWRLLGIQLAVLVIITIIIVAFDLDRKTASLFYRDGSGWFLAKKPLWVWLYQFGTIPGLMMTLVALIVWLAGQYVKPLEPFRRPCMIVALTSIIAAGLLVNIVFKQHWGRPRPDQTIEFGGRWNYRDVISIGIPGKGESFPCGHCAMGYAFLSLLAFKRQNKYIAYGGASVGIVLGVTLSVARVVQGAHFVSDTLWSLGLVTVVATALCMLPPRGRSKALVPDLPPGRGIRKKSVWAPVIIILVVSLACVGFLTRRPFFTTQDYRFSLESEIKRIEILIDADPEQVNLYYATQPDANLQVNAHGFGWPNFDYQMHFDKRVENNTLQLILHPEARSYFSELDHTLILVLPVTAKDRVQLFFRGSIIEGKPFTAGVF